MSRASEARTVSTSGSSGIAPPPGVVGGARLGALLRATLAGPHVLTRDAHDRGVGRVVARTRGRHFIVRRAEAVRLGPLSQSRLGVAVTRMQRRLGDRVGE